MTGPIHLLIVEDNEADAYLTKETLEADRLLFDIAIVRDGVEACDYLFRRPPFENAKRPELILLDLNLPRLDGAAVLAEMQRDPDLRTIPVVILTSSDAESDIVRSYELGANCYVTKPVGLDAFQSIVKSVESFWFTVVRLP
ncbi:response regulator [Novosphingobium album (ex Liu et al. 2023)]|uniref:Response regulator n=1 Tax=Novosphingobium album (ex Liu et al. 2023) TaxID=3031130 RepID=A0ABT5WS69_9SPHN|nr:response regulator [Novosphingobium album (ex Liu et al. 2023)]MDE8652586.1 response regulator [Novosphingobium album (ex Liu et al. 2023)]